jgi:hypothetical protein
MTTLLVHLAVVTLRRFLGPAAPYRIFFVLHSPLFALSDSGLRNPLWVYV